VLVIRVMHSASNPPLVLLFAHGNKMLLEVLLLCGCSCVILRGLLIVGHALSHAVVIAAVAACSILFSCAAGGLIRPLVMTAI